jgi:serine phosphatase RsbU (regulator of sigma subunit)
MALLSFLELPLFALIGFAVVRGAEAVKPPYGRRMLWIGVLLALQLNVWLVFFDVYGPAGPSHARYAPAQVLWAMQIVRLVLIFAAARAWFGIVRVELTHRWQFVALGAAWLALGWGPSGIRFLAAAGIYILLWRMKTFESLSGWRRALGFLASATWLVALTFLPAYPAAKAPALPLDHAVRAGVDLFRIQLLALALKLLFLPIRLAGMSLKRRFWFNFVLVRTIPSLLSTLVLFGILYLAIGYTKAVRVRGAFEQTLARAATAANALADEPPSRSGDGARLDHVRQWMAPNGENAFVIVRPIAGAARVSAGTPAEIVTPALSYEDTAVTRGLYPRGDGLYLTVVRRSEAGTIEIWVPVDSLYLERTMRTIGGCARLSALPNHFVSSRRLKISGDSTWTDRLVRASYTEPASTAGNGPRWYVNRMYLLNGDWLKPPGEGWRGAIELSLESTPRSLMLSTFKSLAGLYSNLTLLLILAAIGLVFGVIESFAVRSGRSIVKAVVDEVGVLRKAAEEIGAGHLEYRLPVSGKDEISIVATSINEMAENLARQRRELIAAERFEEDLAVARAIQQRFLPQGAPSLAGLDMAGVSIPSKEVGGDLFYWFAHDDGTLGFVLGDVAGKSVPAALLMSNVLAALRAQAIERVELSASLERTNRLIAGQTEPGRFVTLFHGEADPVRNELRYVSAGHNPPLLVRANDGLEWLREGGLPLGVLPAATYQTTTIAFMPGDLLIVYSDGVTEAQGPKRAPEKPGADALPELFGDERLSSLARNMRGRPARQVLEAVLDGVRQFANGVEQADDITIIVVRRV